MAKAMTQEEMEKKIKELEKRNEELNTALRGLDLSVSRELGKMARRLNYLHREPEFKKLNDRLKKLEK